MLTLYKHFIFAASYMKVICKEKNQGKTLSKPSEELLSTSLKSTRKGSPVVQGKVSKNTRVRDSAREADLQRKEFIHSIKAYSFRSSQQELEITSTMPRSF